MILCSGTPAVRNKQVPVASDLVQSSTKTFSRKNKNIAEVKQIYCQV